VKETINKDTYQTLKEVKVNSEQALRAVTPMWKKNTNESSVSLFVATPVHSECSIHYTQALLELQQICFKHKIKVTFSLIKSSLVTQGRNLCVAGFLESNYTHMLFIDSDIYFDSSSIIEMIKRDKELISIPYPLKTIMWDKALHKIEKGLIKTTNDLKKAFNTYPMKVEKNDDISVDNGVIEVTHSPTGCMMIKRSVFDKMIKAYPDKNIIQKTVINGEYVNRPNLWNFFDTLHDPITKTYMGEDFSFCQRWKDIGGKCYAYITDSIVHIGEHQYEGRFADELKPSK
jgi:hypothetical protein|tara:strand:+ start:287 stop:1150 length:864 start_codon:yes stop_codon:yes gene_type:complete